MTTLIRYDYCKDNLIPYLKKCGFNPYKDLKFMSCSGLSGAGLLEPVGDLAPWYKYIKSILRMFCRRRRLAFLFREEPFIPYLDSLPSLQRNIDGPFMMPIVDKYTDMGTVVIGKVESGQCSKGQTLAIYPNRTEVKVDQVSFCRVLTF